jgi:chromosome segregation ATPase
MNLDPAFVTIVVAFIASGGVWFLVRPNSQKLSGDAWSSLSSSINLLSRRVDELEREKSAIFDLLEKEKNARTALEQKLIEAGQRISALEDERDRYIAENARKDARILELESQGNRRGGLIK